MSLDPAAAWRSVQALNQVIGSGEKGIASLPFYLAQVLESEAWREFQPPMGPVRRPATFREFVEAEPLDGLGTTVETVEALIKSHPDKAERVEAQRALRLALKAGRGGSPDRSKDGKLPSLTDGGQSTDYAIQRLHDQAPDLYAEVTSGRLSVHAAAVRAGFRRPTATVRLDDIDRAMSVLLKHYTPDDVVAALSRVAGKAH